MGQPANYLPYESTGFFSKIVTDYLADAPALQPFYLYRPDITGIKKSIEARQQFPQQRAILVEALTEQYREVNRFGQVADNILSLADANTFTVTTAHQPNIFTGPLYFIYKIMHTIALAEELNSQLHGKHFVPVYYMGSEDADLDELGFVYVGNRKLNWGTKQTGAVGRMKVDKALIKLIHEIHGQSGVLPFGDELDRLFTSCYTEGKLIQQATLELVNELFGAYGLVVLVPDNAKLKKQFQPVIEKELLQQFSHKAVNETIAALNGHYKVQAGGRALNLFYLTENKRERIELTGDTYEVKALNLSFTRKEIIEELETHPERFSANVILRGAFQETVLPNIAFIGGGGELAYWLELKQVFAAASIPYPVLVLRNSFIIVKKEQAEKISQLGFATADMFRDEFGLINELMLRETKNQVSLSEELKEAQALYVKLKQLASRVDQSLADHVLSLEAAAMKKIEALEKKLLRAERRKYETQQRQIAKLKQELFPANSLQERYDNFSLWYAQHGRNWLEFVRHASTPFNEGFGVITVD